MIFIVHTIAGDQLLLKVCWPDAYGWSGVNIGKLLALAANEFDAFITVDKHLPYQQNLTTLPVAVVVLDAVSNELPALLALLPLFEESLLALEPRTYLLMTRVA